MPVPGEIYYRGRYGLKDVEALADGKSFKGTFLVSPAEGADFKPICDDNFEDNTKGPNVACRSLGLPYGHAEVSNIEGPDSNFSLDDVTCTGDETEVLKCKYILYTGGCSAGETI